MKIIRQIHMHDPCCIGLLPVLYQDGWCVSAYCCSQHATDHILLIAATFFVLFCIGDRHANNACIQ